MVKYLHIVEVVSKKERNFDILNGNNKGKL